jgi:tRNA (guanine37-N1)-methyltransferase
MRIDFITIFPAVFAGMLESSLIRHAREKGVLDVQVHDLRDHAHDRHRTVDDVPYGGGPGMVFKPEPLFEAIEALKGDSGKIILPTPAGKTFTQGIAEDLARLPHLLFVCARYEGVDERIAQRVDYELSIGDFVTMGGELPAMMMTEAVVRFVEGVIGQRESVSQDSFQDSLLDYPHYTRPEVFREEKVPDVLISGNHEQIRIWRRKMALKRTLERRPDLLEKARLTQEDLKLLEEIRKDLK